MTEPTRAHHDALETRPAAEREAALVASLPRQVAAAQRTAAFGELLAGVDAANITSRAALARLPVLRKHELLELQKAQRASATQWDPFGGFSAIGWTGLRAPRGAKRVFQSPGPIYEPEGEGRDYWRVARALHAAGFSAGDLIHNSFSYHLTPAGSMMETGAHALGCTVFAGGVGNTELQLQAMQELRPHGYCGTPSFLRIVFEKAAEAGITLPSLTKALVSGEAFPPSLRDWLAERGVQGYQCYATADVGLIAYETSARQGLVLDEGVLLEIVRPGTGDPVPEGEVGEVVVTVLQADYRWCVLAPVICRRCSPAPVLPAAPTPASRLAGSRGPDRQGARMFVHPSQVAEVARRHPEVQRARLVVAGEMANDSMTLHIEVPAHQTAWPHASPRACAR